MRQRRAVSIELVEENGATVVVRRFADGEVLREPVTPRTKSRKSKRPPLRLSRPKNHDHPDGD